MTVAFYRRYTPRLGVTRLVDGRSSFRRPRYIGFRLNLWRWALEMHR